MGFQGTWNAKEYAFGGLCFSKHESKNTTPKASTMKDL